ncbi:MAG: ATP-binding protein [Bacteroidota bacterium]
MKKQLSIFALLLAFFTCSQNGLEAQSPQSMESLEIERFTLPNGRHGNHVQAIVQDNYGFMWFGSQYGLHRWDGHRFKTYVHGTWDGTSISSNYIETIYVARDGSLWIGTWGDGLNHFHHETDKFKRFRYDRRDGNSLSNDHISVITEDNDGHLWVGTQKGLTRIHLATGEMKRFLHKKRDKSSIDCDQIRALYVDAEGTLWVGTGFPFFGEKEGGLNRYDAETESFTRFLPDRNDPESLSSHHVRIITEDSRGRLWVGSENSIQLFDRKREKFTKSPVQMSLDINQENKDYPHMTFFFEDNRRRYWTGHFAAGIMCADPATQQQVYFNNRESTPSKRRLKENAAWTIVQSKDGVIWVSTASENGRVYRIKEPTVIINDIDPLPINDPVVENTTPSVLDRLRDSSRYFPSNPSNGAPVEDATNDDPPKIVDDAKKPEVIEVESKADGLLWIIKNDESGELQKRDTRTGVTELYHVEQPTQAHVDWKSQPREDLNGNYWVCLENGLLKLDSEVRKGLFYDGKKMGGKPPFKGMVMDQQGVFWVLGQTLMKFEPENERAFSFENQTSTTNLPVTADRIYTNTDGEIVLQTDDDIYRFNPSEWKDSLNAPILRITDFELLDLEEMAAFDSSQQASFWETNWLVLDHFQNAFFFRFAVMDFQSPELHQMEYMLENHDKNWRKIEGDPRAIYANVPPGMYRFKVRGANQFGIWGDEASLNVVIKTPWWKSWWAYILYGLLALLLIFLIYRSQLNKRLAENETVRLKELHATKSRLYTNITHEFRTPLTIIMGMAKQIRENPKAHLDNGLDLIGRNGQQLLGLVNQLLDLSKLEGGKMELKPTHGDLVHFIKGEVEGMDSYARNKGIGLHFIPDMDHLDMSFDREKMQQVVANILSNAIKFTPHGGNVYVNMSANDNDPGTASRRLTLKIRDTGKGIPSHALPKIFDRFYQVDGSSTREGEGSGVGLSLTKEIVELMGGEIKVKSWEGTGSEFIVYLPIKKKGRLTLSPPSTAQPSATKHAGTDSKAEQLPAAPVILPLQETKPTPTILPAAFTEDDDRLPTLLLIEDNPDVVAYLATCLQDQYKMLVGKDGQEGLEIALDRIPDIIITDVMMPRKDGFEVSKILKNDQRTSHIPVIMLTAKADMESKLEGLEQGVDAYLSKPFNKEELLLRLKKLLEGRRKLQQYYQSVAGLAPAPVPSKENGQTVAKKETTEQEDYFVIKVRRSVENHLDDYEFNVEKLCRDVGMSHSQLHRKLSALTGLSANKFIRSIRLNKAKELLREQPPMTVTAVAMDCGFNDPGYFGRVFKKEYGMTPMEWQEGELVGE